MEATSTSLILAMGCGRGQSNSFHSDFPSILGSSRMITALERFSSATSRMLGVVGFVGFMLDADGGFQMNSRNREDYRGSEKVAKN
jgi:hypothetical protein